MTTATMMTAIKLKQWVQIIGYFTTTPEVNRGASRKVTSEWRTMEGRILKRLSQMNTSGTLVILARNNCDYR